MLQNHTDAFQDVMRKLIRMGFIPCVLCCCRALGLQTETVQLFRELMSSGEVLIGLARKCSGQLFILLCAAALHLPQRRMLLFIIYARSAERERQECAMLLDLGMGWAQLLGY